MSQQQRPSARGRRRRRRRPRTGRAGGFDSPSQGYHGRGEMNVMLKIFASDDADAFWRLAAPKAGSDEPIRFLKRVPIPDSKKDGPDSMREGPRYELGCNIFHYIADLSAHKCLARYIEEKRGSPGWTLPLSEPNSYGWTPLHKAAQSGCVECIKCLVDAGVPDLYDNQGLLGLEHAFRGYRDACMRRRGRGKGHRGHRVTDKGDTLVLKGSGALRESPDKKSPVVKLGDQAVVADAKVTQVKRSKAWVRVRTDSGVEGWIERRHTKEPAEEKKSKFRASVLALASDMHLGAAVNVVTDKTLRDAIIEDHGFERAIQEVLGDVDDAVDIGSFNPILLSVARGLKRQVSATQSAMSISGPVFRNMINVLATEGQDDCVQCWASLLRMPKNKEFLTGRVIRDIVVSLRRAARMALCCHDPNADYATAYLLYFVPALLQRHIDGEMDNCGVANAADAEQKSQAGPATTSPLERSLDSIWVLLDTALRDIDRDIDSCFRFVVTVHMYWLWTQVFPAVPGIRDMSLSGDTLKAPGDWGYDAKQADAELAQAVSYYAARPKAAVMALGEDQKVAAIDENGVEKQGLEKKDVIAKPGLEQQGLEQQGLEQQGLEQQGLDAKVRPSKPKKQNQGRGRQNDRKKRKSNRKNLKGLVKDRRISRGFLDFAWRHQRAIFHIAMADETALDQYFSFLMRLDEIVPQGQPGVAPQDRPEFAAHLAVKVEFMCASLQRDASRQDEISITVNRMTPPSSPRNSTRREGKQRAAGADSTSTTPRGSLRDNSLHHRALVRESLMNQLLAAPPATLRSTIDVRYVGEAGVGAGPLRELLSMMADDLFSPDARVFVACPGGTHLTINTAPPDQAAPPGGTGDPNSMLTNYLAAAGRMLALAITQRQPLGPRLCSFIVRRLLKKGDTIGLDDLKDFDPALHRSMRTISAANTPEKLAAAAPDMTFTCSVPVRGGAAIQDVSLSSGPGNRRRVVGASLSPDEKVTVSNRTRFVQRYAQVRLTHGIGARLRALENGFQKILPPALSRCLTVAETQLLIQGPDALDVASMKKHVRYKGGFNAKSSVIQYFWELVEGYSAEQRADLLMFWSGSRIPPVHGFDPSRTPDSETWTIEMSRVPSTHLPTASTCMYVMRLPPYPNKQTLAARLELALKFGSHGYDRE